MKKKHIDNIPGYSLEELADFIVGKLRYDKAAEFHKILSHKYRIESSKEDRRGRKKLSKSLKKTADIEYMTSISMEEVWKICEPYTE